MQPKRGVPLTRQQSPPAPERPAGGSAPPTSAAAAPRPRSAGAGAEARPGLKEQVGRTRAAIGRLVAAHVTLLRAEIGEIVGQLKLIALLGGLLAALGLFTANLLLIGLLLFLGEWIFGSLGWGLLHGVLLLAGVMTAIAMTLFSAPGRVVTGALLGAVVVGLAVGLLLAFNLPRRGAEALASAVRASGPTLDPAQAPVIVAIVAGALVLGILGLVIGARAGGAPIAVAALVGGLIIGALIGWPLGSVAFSLPGAIATALAAALAAWPILQLGMAASAGVDPGARFRRLWPRETYETALETRAWLEAEWLRRRSRLARR